MCEAYPFQQKKNVTCAKGMRIVSLQCIYSTNALAHICVSVEHFILALLPVATR